MLTSISSLREYVMLCGRQVIGDSFLLNDDLLHNYKLIANYLFKPEESMRNGIDPNKSLWLGGNPGNGKSSALKVMARMILNSGLDVSHRYKIITYKEIERQYKTYNNEIFDLYGAKNPNNIAIDEVLYDEGLSPADFGKKINLFEELIFDRCMAFVETGVKTHISSNFSIRLIKEEKILDVRVRDRFSEMYNDIQWKGSSLRNIIMKGGANG